jgi:hypothetical protein
MNEYLEEMSKYLASSKEARESGEANLDKDKMMESFMQFQNYLKTQQGAIPVQQNPGSMSTSGGSDGFNKRGGSAKLEEYEDKPTFTFQNTNVDKGGNIDDIPILPKANNFMELLNKQLENAEDVQQDSHKPVKKIHYQPRPRRSDLLNISKPTETKKYKYYSQNFNKDFGKDDDNVEEVTVIPSKVMKDFKPPTHHNSFSRPKSVKDSIQNRDQRMKE